MTRLLPRRRAVPRPGRGPYRLTVTTVRDGRRFDLGPYRFRSYTRARRWLDTQVATRIVAYRLWHQDGTLLSEWTAHRLTDGGDSCTVHP